MVQNARYKKGSVVSKIIGIDWHILCSIGIYCVYKMKKNAKGEMDKKKKWWSKSITSGHVLTMMSYFPYLLVQKPYNC